MKSDHREVSKHHVLVPHPGTVFRRPEKHIVASVSASINTSAPYHQADILRSYDGTYLMRVHVAKFSCT